MTPRFRNRPAPRRRMAGLSLVELMIAMALGLIVLGALATLFANSSRARAELERDSRQIENGRFAMELLTEDLRLAGFYGELNLRVYTPPSAPAPGALPDPCDINPAAWPANMMFHVQGYDNGVGVPATCPLDAQKPGTDVVVVRRVATCEAGVGTCPAAVSGAPYFQAARCNTEVAEPTTAYKMGLQGGGGLNAHARNCTTISPLRRYMVNIYYVSQNNGYGQPIPTLKRLEFTGAGFQNVPLVEGIEELNLEYGIDNAPAHPGRDGQTDVYMAAPPTPADWTDVVAVRINLLARNIESSPGYTDTKSYDLGRDAANNPIIVAPGGDVRRHAYTGLVRVVNPSQRRETP